MKARGAEILKKRSADEMAGLGEEKTAFEF
jgi:hypothetical protein